MKISENVKISTLTTMRIGGTARYVFDVEERDEVRGAYTFAREKNLPVYVLGSGANTLGRDEGFDGVIIRNRILGIEKIATREGMDLDFSGEDLPELSEDSELFNALDLLQSGETLWRAFGGEVWNDFVIRTAEEGFTGVETLAAIPGTVGAAPVQNIGAYGHDVSETIFAVEVFDTRDGEYKILFPSELDFSYRHSIFNSFAFGRYFIVSVYFKLRKGTVLDPLPDGSPAPALYNSLQAYIDENNITDFSPVSIAEAVTAIREDKLPDPAKIASAGSFFKNVYLSDAEAKAAEAKGVPIRRTLVSGSEKSGSEKSGSEKPGSEKSGDTGKPGDAVYENKVNTGWLVEHCGLMGKNLHGFHINEKAALVLVNDSSESYSDLAAARDEIRAAVSEKFGIEIDQEPVELENVSNEASTSSEKLNDASNEASMSAEKPNNIEESKND